MDNEGWPQPAGLQGVLRRLLGRPATDGTDDLAMRADAERLGDELADETNTNDQAIHPGFHGLVSRSGQRMARRMRHPSAALAKALAKHTEAQAALDRREYDRGVVARLVDDLPPLPAAPRLGVALTQPWAVWLLMLLVLIPLEGVLTYQQILILGLDVNLTKLFAALIGAALTVSAEVLGTLVAHLGSQADGDRRSTQHRGTYWMAALLVCVTATVAVATISTLATSREANQQIVEQRRQQIEQLDRQFNRPGYTSPDGPPAAVQEQTDSAKINLGFTLWLQLLGLLAAVGLGLRRRLAEDYQAAATMRRTTLRRAQFSERAVSRGERAVTRSAGRQEAVMRTMRTIVEDEYRFLQSLFQRTLQRYRMASGNAAEGCPTPELPELEDVIRHFLEPELPRLAQPTTASVPVAQPPPPPLQWEPPPPRPRPQPPPGTPYAPYPPGDAGPWPPDGREPVAAPPSGEYGDHGPAARPSDDRQRGPSSASEYAEPPVAAGSPSEYDADPVRAAPAQTPRRPGPTGYHGPDPTTPPARPYDAPRADPPPAVPEPQAPARRERGSLRGVGARLRRIATRPAADEPVGAAAPATTHRRPVDEPADRAMREAQRVSRASAGTAGPAATHEGDPTRWRRLEPPGSIHPDAPYRDTLARLEQALDRTSGPGREET